jgi:sec-independent protein translocase protein TatA
MNSFVIAGMIGPQEIIIILIIVLLLFGGRKIPELMKGLGKGMKEFKKASKGEDDNNSEQEKLEE